METDSTAFGTEKEDGVMVRDPLRIFLLGMALLSGFGSQVVCAAEQPNIIFIFADDWGWGDLSCHGHPYVKTPNIDRLASEGSDFFRFTVASGVCSPSRTAIMTGHFPARYNINGHFAWVDQNARRNMPDWLDPAAPLLPRMLQGAGYMTGHFGKWHLANDMIPDSPLPSEYGYDKYGAFNCAGEQMPVHDDVNQAISLITEAIKKQKPFFINLWMHEPHTPFHVLPKYRWWFRDLENEADNIYAATLAHADDRIGHLLAVLDQNDLTKKTLVIFSSDNGPARAASPTELKLSYDTATGAGFGIGASKGVTGGRKGYKAALFEGGVCVPFIARWPGKIPAGVVDNQTLLSAVDIVPTLCELAGATMPAGYTPDGVSQVEALSGNAIPTREKPLFWKATSPWPAPKNRPFHWGSYAVVDDRWKLIGNADLSYVELYAITEDQLESTECGQQYPEVVSALKKRLEEWQATLPPKPTGPVFSSGRSQQNL